MLALLGKLDPRTALRIGVWLLLGLLLAMGVRALTASESRVPDETRDILSADIARRNHANALALDSARVALSKSSARTLTSITRYLKIRDTLRLTDTVAVKETLVRADSVARSCTELVESCSAFRVRAESSLAGLRLDRDRWKDRASRGAPRSSASLSVLYDPTASISAVSGDVEYRLFGNLSVIARADQRFAPGERPHGYVGGKVRL